MAFRSLFFGGFLAAFALSALAETIPLRPALWRNEYKAPDEVKFSRGHVAMSPPAPESPEKTHAVLLVSKKKFRYFQAEIRFRNVRPLRTPQPNAWEVFWVFFNYAPMKNMMKKTNYVLFKPNGAELGRAWNDTDQEILKTWTKPALGYGETHVIKIRRTGTRITLQLDHEPRLVYRFDRGKMTLPDDRRGSIGLYTEDADVIVESVKVSPL